MEVLISEALKQAPSLGVLVVLVVLFLRQLSAMHKDGMATITENSKVLGEVAGLLRRLNGGK